MSCTTTAVHVMTESYEEPVFRKTTSYGTFEARRKRRHSFYDTRSFSMDCDNVQLMVSGRALPVFLLMWAPFLLELTIFLKVDRFLSELGRRLDFLDSYGSLQLDASIERAYATLQAVRESCANISDGVLDAGRRRASVLVETLEGRYKEALATKETLEQKVYEAVRLMEATLSDFEARAYAMKDASMTVGQDFLGGGWRHMEEGLERAKGVVDEGLGKARSVKDSVRESIEATITLALARAKEYGHLKYEELPEPWQNNPYILKGYRFHASSLECIRSTLEVSNELFNIWSHAIGFLIILSIAFYFYPTSSMFSSSTKADVFIAAIFFFAACKCLVCSTVSLPIPQMKCSS
jgi:adiponectin receptor